MTKVASFKTVLARIERIWPSDVNIPAFRATDDHDYTEVITVCERCGETVLKYYDTACLMEADDYLDGSLKTTKVTVEDLERIAQRLEKHIEEKHLL